MALILDKTTTGITSTVLTSGTSTYTDSGYTITGYTNGSYFETIYFQSGYTKMVYLTGFTNLTYIDESGNIYDNPYLTIDAVTINKLVRHAKISVSIYKDINSRKNSKKPIFDQNYNVINVLYDEYFSTSEMEDIDIFTKAYEYISTVYLGWKSDE